jgi:hypothetical protein
MPAEADYSFPPLTRSDYARMRGWLDQPHVRAWWGDPDTEIALIDADIDGDTADLRLVAYQGRPFAYVQDYPAHHDPMPQYAEFPPGTRAMDTFLGEPDMLGQGHALSGGGHRSRPVERARRAGVSTSGLPSHPHHDGRDGQARACHGIRSDIPFPLVRYASGRKPVRKTDR